MKQRRPESFGSHNRSWIWGRHVVLETLRAGRWRPRELCCSSACPPEARCEVEQLAARWQLSLSQLDDDGLSRRCRSEAHQGLAALMPAFPYASWDAVASNLSSVKTCLVLDGIQDSFNFGAMVRTAHGLGVQVVLVGMAEQAEVNSQVVRSSAGAVNYVPIVRVESLTAAVDALREHGSQLVAATESGEESLDQFQWSDSAALVIGNEGRGIRPELLDRCAHRVQIPMAGRVGSLNAAVAAGIFCFAMTRGRRA